MVVDMAGPGFLADLRNLSWTSPTRPSADQDGGTASRSLLP
jgi:hypothetical protein